MKSKPGYHSTFFCHLIWIFLCQIISSPAFTQDLTITPDTAICFGGIATLHVSSTTGTYGTDSYSFESIPYTPEPFSGGTAIDPLFTHCGATSGGKDDCWAGPLDIGFNFCFFNQVYSQFWVGSNGWIGFTDPTNHNWTTFTARVIPDNNPDDATPKNCMFFPWEDWLPDLDNTPNVFYYQTGSSPDRKLVVYWHRCPFFAHRTDTSINATFQVVIHEQNSIIENNIAHKPQVNENATQGVHRVDGLVAFTATGRNCTQWFVDNESTRFVPSGVKWYTGGYPGGLLVGYGSTFTASPSQTTRYTCVMTTCAAGLDTASVLVTVENPAFNYNSSVYCANLPDPIPVTVQNGGYFSSKQPGVVFISTSTGEIDLSASVPGTYDIIYHLTSPIQCNIQHTLTINNVPSPPGTNNPFIKRCGPGSVTLTATSGPNQKITWYNAPVGGTLYPFTGSPVNTTISVTTSFYAEVTDTISGCTSLSRTEIVVMIKPIPVISNSVMNDTICSEGFTNISIQSSPPGSTYTWTGINTIGNVTGFTSSGSGGSITDQLTNHLSTLGIVSYSVIPTLDSCTGPVKNFLVAVKSKPDVYFVVSSDTICSGQNIHILLQSHFPGTLFTWIAHGSAGISGFAAGSGTQINQVIFNSDYIPGTVTYIVTPAGACTGIPDSVTITVHPLPSVSFLSCNDTMVYIYTKPFKLAGGLPPGGIYSGAGYNPGTQMFYPVTAGTGIHILHYTYTNMFSCVSQASMRIHVLGSVLFNCGQNLVDIRDGRSYPTLTIGGQCWMRSNLNFGNPVSFLQSQRDNCLREKYCYNDITSNCASSGGLYQWDEVMQYQQDEGIQGFCPAGWHIPTQQDWITLFSNFTNNGFAGMPLKFTGYSGFNAFLNGLLFMDREWDFDTFATFFWSSTYHGMDRAWAHGMNSVNPSVSDYPALRSNAFSVRCLKD